MTYTETFANRCLLLRETGELFVSDPARAAPAGVGAPPPGPVAGRVPQPG